MKAIFGWGRPLYDEELARRILQHKGVAEPSTETVQHFARQLRRKTIEIRIFSVVTGILLILVIAKGILGR